MLSRFILKFKVVLHDGHILLISFIAYQDRYQVIVQLCLSSYQIHLGI